VQLDDISAARSGCLDLIGFRFDEKADLDAALMEPLGKRSIAFDVSGDCQAPFRRELLTLLRYQRHQVRHNIQGNDNDLFGSGHLKVELGGYDLPQHTDVAVVHVATVLTQVTDNTAGTGQFGKDGRMHGIGLNASAGFSERGYVINVDGKTDGHDLVGKQLVETSRWFWCYKLLNAHDDDRVVVFSRLVNSGPQRYGRRQWDVHQRVILCRLAGPFAIMFNKLMAYPMQFFLLATLVWCCVTGDLYSQKTPATSVASAPSASIDGLIGNVGQWPSHVLYAYRSNGQNVWVTRYGTEVDTYTTDRAAGMRNGRVESRRLLNAGQAVTVVASEQVSTVSFFLGRNSSQWFAAPVYRSVVIRDAAPGVSVEYRAVGRGLEQHFILDQGVSPSAASVVVEPSADGGSPRAIVSPTSSIVYASYVGGPSDDQVAGIEYLSNGEVVIGGTTSSLSYPGVTGGYSTSLKGVSDGYLVRLDRKLQRVLSYSFYGGNGEDRINSLVRDKANSIYITGETSSADLPVTSGASGQLYKAGIDAYIAKFDSTLTRLQISGYHGGNKDDIGVAIAVDQNGVIFLAGNTNSTTNLPVTFPVTITRRDWRGRTFTEPGGGSNQGVVDIFLAFFSVNGSMQQSRYFGRSGIDRVTAMCIDGSNSVYFTGSTTSPDFETSPTPGFFSSGRLPYDRTFNGGTTDAFVVKMNNELQLAKSDDGTYSTFFGGNGDEEGRGIFVDEIGRAQVVGVTKSTNLETIGTLVTQPIGDQDIFLAVFPDDGRNLTGATYFGGTGKDDVRSVRFNSVSRLAVLCGATQSGDFPVAGDGASNERIGPTDGFITLMNTSTNSYTTLLGGSDEDTVVALSVDPVGDLYYVTSTTSDNLRLPDSAAQGAVGGSNAYVGKYAIGTVELTVPSGDEVWCAGSNRAISWSAQVLPDSTKYSIELAPAGSSNWTVLTRTALGRSFSWKVPNVPTGLYQMRITTSRGHMSRLLTPFTISNPPSIKEQPKDASACLGGRLVLRVVAEGAGLKYQWRRGGNNIAGATADTLVIPALDAAALGRYDCVITGTCAPNATSAAVNVTTAVATAISRQPSGVAVDAGRPFTLSVAATGSNLAYQWLRNGAPITGATSADYTVASASKADEGEYTCRVEGGCGTVTSEKAIVAVTTTSVDEEVLAIGSLRLVGSHPVADMAHVRFELPVASEVTASLIDLQGRLVARLNAGMLAQGTHDMHIPTTECQSGTHLLKIAAGATTWTLRIQVVR